MQLVQMCSVLLALGEHLVGSPVRGVTAACRVVLVQLAVADRHRSMRIWVAVDVEDENITRLATVVALAGLVPSFVQ